MNNEPYDLPPAYSLPERMNEYYSFLCQPDIHPLIKAAVSQAFLLVTRPFPEGNERLSRMMSCAVLLRCGYDFFRDISISSVIARENYRYYKAMCDILRPENGGDLTYFIEYYIELLARAVVDRKERLMRRQQENLEKERAMAVQPLRPDEKALEEREKNMTDQSESNQQAIIPPEVNDDTIVVGEHIPMAQYLAEIDKMKHSPNTKTRRTPAIIREMLSAGIYTFTVRQWAERAQEEANLADSQCRYLFQKGLLDRDKSGPVMSYTFRVIRDDEEKATAKPDVTDNESQHVEPNESPPQIMSLKNWIAVYARSEDKSKQFVAVFFQRMIRENKATFTSKDMAEYAGLSAKQAKNICSYLVRRHIAFNTCPNAKPTVFQLVGMPAGNALPQDNPPAKKTMPNNIQEKTQQPESNAQNEVPAALYRMLQSKSDVMRRAGEAVKQMAEQGKNTFLRREWPTITGLSKGRANDTCDVMLKLGIICKESPEQRPAQYRINLASPPPEQALLPIPTHKLNELAVLSSSVQESRIKEFLKTRIENGQTQFTTTDWQSYFDLKKSSCNNDLRIASGLGLITKIGKNSHHCDIYMVNQTPIQEVRTGGLTDKQIQYLQAIYDEYGKKQFSVYDCASLLNQKPSSVTYYLKLYVNRGILSFERHGFERGYYAFQVSPATHPECFVSNAIRIIQTTE